MAPSATPAIQTELNFVVISGHLSSDPVSRTLPSGDEVHQFEVTSKTGDPDMPSVSAPVVWFGERKGRPGKEGDAVVILGVVRRRFYRAGGATHSRTEVVASRLTISPNQRSRQAAMNAAQKALSR